MRYISLASNKNNNNKSKLLNSVTHYTKIYKAFQEFIKVGLVDDKEVRFRGAQAVGCSPIATAFKEGRDLMLFG